MPLLPAQVIGEAYTDKFCWNVLNDLVEIGNRMAGQKGEKKGAEVLKDAYTKSNLSEIKISEFEIPGWWRGSSSLSTSSPFSHHFQKDHQVIALPGGPSGKAEGELIDVGYGFPEEIGEKYNVSNKIVLARSDTPDDYGRWIHRMEKYAAAADAGADGFIFSNHMEGALPPTGEIGYHKRPGPIPAVGVSKEVGTRLGRYDSQDIIIDLDVQCRNETSTSVNVEGVTGPDTEEEVLVTAHIDSHDISEGARDNAAGSALVAEIGRLLGEAENKLDTRVRCLTFGSEEIGLRGAYHWTDKHDLDNVKCVLNIDGAGYSRMLDIGTMGFTSMISPFSKSAQEFGFNLEKNDEIRPHADSWAFAERGVPAVIAGSVTGPGRGWTHTHADTLDKIDVRDMHDLAIVFTEIVIQLADTGFQISHKNSEEVRDGLTESYIEELKIGGRWHY